MAVITTTVAIPAGVTSSNDIVICGGELQVASGGSIVGTIVAHDGSARLSPPEVRRPAQLCKITLPQHRRLSSAASSR